MTGVVVLAALAPVPGMKTLNARVPAPLAGVYQANPLLLIMAFEILIVSPAASTVKSPKCAYKSVVPAIAVPAVTFQNEIL